MSDDNCRSCSYAVWGDEAGETSVYTIAYAHKGECCAPAPACEREVQTSKGVVSSSKGRVGLEWARPYLGCATFEAIEETSAPDPVPVGTRVIGAELYDNDSTHAAEPQEGRSPDTPPAGWGGLIGVAEEAHAILAMVVAQSPDTPMKHVADRVKRELRQRIDVVTATIKEECSRADSHHME